MSSSSISSSGLSANSSIQSTGSMLQITGLASGIDTNALIQALLADQKQPITNLTNHQTGLTALNSQLKSVQSGLRTLTLNAQRLADPGLFTNSQTVSSSNSALVSATTATGAGTGGYQVAVTQLANSAQRTFTFNSPASADTITIDGHDTQLGANASTGDFVNAINSDPQATVYAATTSDNTVVLSSRTTGTTGTNFIQVSDPATSLSEQATFAFTSPTANDVITINGNDTALTAGASMQDFVDAINRDPNSSVRATTTNANTVILTSLSSGTRPIQASDSGESLVEQGGTRAGQDTLYTVDGVAGSSHSNTSTGAVAGITLTFGGLTTTPGPVTVTVGAPGPNSAGIQAAVKTFVDSYNAMIDQITGQITQKPVSSDPTQGRLFGDNELTALMTNMRTTMYTPGTTLPTPGQTLPGDWSKLADIGISTGAGSGTSPFSQDSVSGKLTIDATALANAITTNSGGVKAILQSWSQSFSKVVKDEAQSGGALDARINGDNSEISSTGSRIDTLNSMLDLRQKALTAQFAKMEATLSTLQSQNNWLTSQLASLPLPAAL